MTTIVLSSGGTGGHLFPAEALAKALLARGYHVALLTDARAANFADAASGVEICQLNIRRPTRVKTVTTTLMLFRIFGTLLIQIAGIGFLCLNLVFILRSLFQAMGYLQRLKPALVIGFGGYPSFPGVMAAQLMGIPTLIDEQNTVMGRANRALAPLANAIATSFPKVKQVSGRLEKKLVYVGHPVRASFEAIREVPYQPPGDTINLLVTGGSQGATIFATVVPDAIAKLPDDLRRRLHVTQQCRAEDLDQVAARYRDIGVAAETTTFFAHLASILATAHLSIGRSGASTVIESAIAGRPSIFVPLPYAISDEQTSNAWGMETAGAAIMIKQVDFTPDYLATRLEALLTDPARLAQMAAAARASGKPGAAASLANLVGDVIEGNARVAA